VALVRTDGSQSQVTQKQRAAFMNLMQGSAFYSAIQSTMEIQIGAVENSLGLEIQESSKRNIMQSARSTATPGGSSRAGAQGSRQARRSATGLTAAKGGGSRGTSSMAGVTGAAHGSEATIPAPEPVGISTGDGEDEDSLLDKSWFIPCVFLLGTALLVITYLLCSSSSSSSAGRRGTRGARSRRTKRSKLNGRGRGRDAESEDEYSFEDRRETRGRPESDEAMDEESYLLPHPRDTRRTRATRT
jgi:hypothetical protein